ncbi:MAG: hypothetical protein RSP_24210 [Rhodanobacter sp.]
MPHAIATTGQPARVRSPLTEDTSMADQSPPGERGPAHRRKTAGGKGFGVDVNIDLGAAAGAGRRGNGRRDPQ